MYTLLNAASASVYAIFALLALALPIAAFRSARQSIGFAWWGGSYLVGIAIWIYSAVVAFAVWGWLAIAAGVLLLGVGMVPIAVLAALWAGSKEHALFLLLGSVVVWVMRLIAAPLIASGNAR